MDGVTPTQIDMDPPQGCDFSSIGARDENAPSGKALESPAPPMLGEAMRPLQECVHPVLGGTQGQSSSRGKISKENRCPPSPIPHELYKASLGDPPNIDGSPTLDLVGTQGSVVLSETNAKGKAKAERCDSVNMDTSMDDIASGG
jgi:hypothetical protein